MPSPFPGMDPYLEDAVLWPGVHHDLITFLRGRINALLPAGYVANINERLYVVQQERDIYPDASVARRPPLADPAGNGSAVAVASDEPLVVEVEAVEVREGFIEIVRVGAPGRVVTTLEVLSPSNKAAGEGRRELYLAKQQAVLASTTHLIEIDLLRAGRHTVAAPEAPLPPSGHWHYTVSLHRGGRGGLKRRFEVWAVTLRQRLPRFRVPLADGDPDLVVELQALFDRCYNEGSYARQVDYRRAPPGALTPADAAWLDEWLRSRGPRP